MSSYESDGDEWKRQPDEPFRLVMRTREHRQRILDDQYAEGKIDRDLWSIVTDAISWESEQ